MSRESLESQVQLSVQEDFASNERYTLSDTKTKCMFLNTPSDQLDIPYSKLNGKEFDKATEYKHIGVLRYADIKTRLPISDWSTTE